MVVRFVVALRLGHATPFVTAGLVPAISTPERTASGIETAGLSPATTVRGSNAGVQRAP
jgi:hypothetical protein